MQHWFRALPLFLLACGGPPEVTWRDQLSPASPCYRVNLADGLDETSAAEVTDLHGCLNAAGAFEALSPTVAALGDDTRANVPAGGELGRAVNALADLDVDVFALAEALLPLLRTEDGLRDAALDLVLELIYGVPAAQVRASEALADADALEAGVLVPLGSMLPIAADAALDDDLRAVNLLTDVLDSEDAGRWGRTVADIAMCDDDDVADAIGALPGDLGDLLGATESSLPELARSLVSGPTPALPAIAPDALRLLGDAEVRSALLIQLSTWTLEGRLRGAISGAIHLALVDVDGDPIEAGDTSALFSIVRLLYGTNRPLECEIDLPVGSVTVTLDNLALPLLELIADLDPDTVQSGAGLLGSLLEFPFSQTLLDSVAESGTCETVTPEVVHDLRALDRMYDPESYDLLVLFIDLLNILKNGEENQIPALADLATALVAADGLAPLDAVIADLDAQDAVDDLFAILPALDDPGLCSSANDAVGYPELLDVVIALLDTYEGRPAYDHLVPTLAPIADADATWTAVAHLGDLLRASSSQTAQITELLPDLRAMEIDPVLFDTVVAVLREPAVVEPALRVVATASVPEALFATEAETEVPLAFGARLIVDGTLDDVFALVDLVFDTLDENTNE